MLTDQQERKKRLQQNIITEMGSVVTTAGNFNSTSDSMHEY